MMYETEGICNACGFRAEFEVMVERGMEVSTCSVCESTTEAPADGTYDTIDERDEASGL